MSLSIEQGTGLQPCLVKGAYHYGERLARRRINTTLLSQPGHIREPGMTVWNGLCSVINGAFMNRQRDHPDVGLRLTMGAGQVAVGSAVGDVHELMRRRVAGDEVGAQEIRGRGMTRVVGNKDRILVSDHVYGVAVCDNFGEEPVVEWVIDVAANQTHEGLLPMAVVATPDELHDMGVDYTIVEGRLFASLDAFFAAGASVNLFDRACALDRRIQGDLIPRDDASEGHGML